MVLVLYKWATENGTGIRFKYKSIRVNILLNRVFLKSLLIYFKINITFVLNNPKHILYEY